MDRVARLKSVLMSLTEWTVRDGWPKRVAIGLTVISLTTLAVSPWYGIYVRDDESLPDYSFFIVKKGVLPQRGEYAAFEMTQEYADRVEPKGPSRPYSRVGRMFLKAAYGVAGDPVRVEGRDVYVNGRRVATVIEQDKYKQRIEPATYPPVIPAGAYYLGLPHPRSFDSRVFGLVDVKDIKGVVWPIF